MQAWAIQETSRSVACCWETHAISGLELKNANQLASLKTKAHSWSLSCLWGLHQTESSGCWVKHLQSFVRAGGQLGTDTHGLRANIKNGRIRNRSHFPWLAADARVKAIHIAVPRFTRCCIAILPIYMSQSAPNVLVATVKGCFRTSLCFQSNCSLTIQSWGRPCSPDSGWVNVLHSAVSYHIGRGFGH